MLFFFFFFKGAFKKAPHKVVDSARRLPTSIELLTFTLEDVRIVNDRPLTMLSDSRTIFYRIREPHDNEDLRRNYTYNSTLALLVKLD